MVPSKFWVSCFIAISFTLFSSSFASLGYSKLMRNYLRKRQADGDDSKTLNDIDDQGRYTGGYNSDCSETLFIGTKSEANIESDPEIIALPKVSCHWTVIGTEICIPVLNCKKFKLVPDTPGAETPCEKEHLEITDGSGGFQRFCGDSPPKDITTAKGLRDLYITFRGSAEEAKLAGRGFKCSITCTAPGSMAQAKALDENSEPDFSDDCTCGRKPNQNRIVGGQDAKRAEFPWIVALVTAHTRKPFCGGTVINDKFVITAAHCFKGPYQNKDNFQLLMNSHALDMTVTTESSKKNLTSAEEAAKLAKEDQEDGTVRFSIDRYFIHPLYVRQTNDYDVALIKLKEPIDFKKHKAIIQPACIPALAMYNTTYENTNAIVAGWGLSSANATSTMAILQKLDVRVFPGDECRSFYHERITRRMMCAGFKEGGKDSCKGDSGGPLVAEKSPQVWQLIGTVSWGEGCAASSAPGVYQRVSEVNQWIRYTCNMESAIWCRG